MRLSHVRTTGRGGRPRHGRRDQHGSRPIEQPKSHHALPVTGLSQPPVDPSGESIRLRPTSPVRAARRSNFLRHCATPRFYAVGATDAPPASQLAATARGGCQQVKNGPISPNFACQGTLPPAAAPGKLPAPRAEANSGESCYLAAHGRRRRQSARMRHSFPKPAQRLPEVCASSAVLQRCRSRTAACSPQLAQKSPAAKQARRASPAPCVHRRCQVALVDVNVVIYAAVDLLPASPLRIIKRCDLAAVEGCCRPA